MNPYEDILKINREAIKRHIEQKNLNYRKFAIILGMDPSHLLRYIKTGVGENGFIWAKLYYYCRVNNLIFDDFLEG